jgi:hypothetical protein
LDEILKEKELAERITVEDNGWLRETMGLWPWGFFGWG